MGSQAAAVADSAPVAEARASFRTHGTPSCYIERVGLCGTVRADALRETCRVEMFHVKRQSAFAVALVDWRFFVVDGLLVGN